MSKARAAPLSDELLQLLHTVERLTTDDQERILRIVSLLAFAPRSAQQEFREMLRGLIDRGSQSARDCALGIDKIIEHLESCVLTQSELAKRRDAFYGVPPGRRLN